MKEIIQNPVNIYTVAFIVFWALVYFFGRKPMIGWLDGEIRKITAELNTAHDLRAEAEAVLADCKAKQAQAERDAQRILQMAKQQAEMMRKQAAEDLDSSLERQQRLVAERIQIAQDNALNAVREAVITMGVELARKNLTENMSNADSAKLIEEAINEIPALKKTQA